MQEATGQAGLMNIMLTIIGIIIALLAGSIAYSKAFRIKNKIVDAIEKYTLYNDEAKTEIEKSLTSVGYRTMDSSKLYSYCNKNKFAGFTLIDTPRPNYLYCIYKSNSNSSGTYHYKVVSFMYFDIPVIGKFIEIPVTGETKTFYSKKIDEWKTVQ